MNPFSSRLPRTIILFVLGVGASFAVAVLLAPVWPGFCDDATVGKPCSDVAVQTMAGYLMVGLGFMTIILGPIAGSFLDLLINGAKWETPRATRRSSPTCPFSSARSTWSWASSPQRPHSGAILLPDT